MKPITAAEHAILELMCFGKTDDEISAILGIARRTVLGRVRRIRRKLGADNRTQAVAKFLAPHLFTKGSQ